MKVLKTRKEKIKQQLKQLWTYVEKVYKEEQKTPNEPDFEEIYSDKFERSCF